MHLVPTTLTCPKAWAYVPTTLTCLKAWAYVPTTLTCLNASRHTHRGVVRIAPLDATKWPQQ
jgi:hypothetical protein